MRLTLAVVIAAAGLVGCAKEERHAAGAASALHLPRRVLSRASRGEHRSPLPRTVPRRLRTHHLRVLGGGGTLSTTAYCATGSRTASGVWPQIGMAAGNRWPFGTHLHIDGYGDVIITDRIGWGSDLDIYFGGGADCEARANTYGRQARRVEVVA